MRATADSTRRRTPETSSQPAGSWVALVTLVVLWLLIAWLTWARWGNPTVDCGREMYVPSILAEGQTLYTDVWYPYGPAAPYLNSLLFRLFGIHLDVLYLAGIACVMLHMLPLFWVASRLSCLAGAFCIGLAVITQSFHPGIFNFPLPYSSAAVYGAVCSSLFLLSATNAALQERSSQVFWAGMWASLALMTKIEFGTACYAALGILTLGRYWQTRTVRSITRDLLLISPGLVVSTMTVAWMISLRGADFLIHENFMSWPTSYFMQHYGEHYLKLTGFDLSARSLWGGAVFVVFFLTLWAAAGKFVSRAAAQPDRAKTWLLYGSAVAVGLGFLGVGGLALGTYSAGTLVGVLRQAFLPDRVPAVVTAAIPIAAWQFWRDPSPRRLALLVLFCCGAALAFRHLFNLHVKGYSIYYNGPAYVALVVLVTRLALRGYDKWDSAPRMWATLAVFAPLAFFILHSASGPYRGAEPDLVPLHTARGTLYLERRKAAGYERAMQWMRHARDQGETIMSIPEDTALYFLSGVPCPTRVIVFSPGLLSPGKMTDELIQEMEASRVKYLLISNRRFDVYGAPEFGIDFDQAVGAYVHKHFRHVQDLTEADNSGAWSIALWERRL